MALQWIDNFQQYGTTAAFMLNGPYAEVNGPTIAADPDPLESGTVLKITSSNNAVAPLFGNYYRRVINPATATIGVAMRIWLTALPSSTTTYVVPITLTDANNASQLSFRVTPTGAFDVYRGSFSAGSPIATSSVGLVANAWQHVEIKAFISSTVGTVEIRVDTVPVLTATGLNTQNTALTTVSNFLGSNDGTGSTNAPTMYQKDLAIWDGSGTFNNSFLGSCFVYSMRPDSDVSGTWSIFGGAGSGWASINETNPDDDTKYVYSPWPAATADVFTLTDLPPDATAVKGLMILARSKKSDGGDATLQASLVSGGSTGNGLDRPITVAYTYWSDIFDTDPATSAQWTVAATNAVKLKLNRTS